MENRMPVQDIQTHIYRIRGQQVMLDSDLAVLYGVPTFRLNEQVRRNVRRFPVDFMFRLTPQELDSLRSQIAILKVPPPPRTAQKISPLCLTEQGVAMLSGVLRSQRAIDVNIAIMRAFVKLRKALAQNQDLSTRVEKMEENSSCTTPIFGCWFGMLEKTKPKHADKNSPASEDFPKKNKPAWQ